MSRCPATSHMANAQSFGVFGNYLAMERRDADAGAGAGRALPSSETERELRRVTIKVKVRTSLQHHRRTMHTHILYLFLATVCSYSVDQ